MTVPAQGVERPYGTVDHTTFRILRTRTRRTVFRSVTSFECVTATASFVRNRTVRVGYVRNLHVVRIKPVAQVQGNGLTESSAVVPQSPNRATYDLGRLC